MTDVQRQNEIDALWSAVRGLQNDRFLPDHHHNGNDASRVNWNDLAQRRYYIAHSLPNTQPQTSGNYTHFFIAPAPCVVTAISEVHQTAGTDSSAVTLQIEKLSGTTAPGSGNSILGTALSLKATANTVQNGVLTMTLADRTLAKGDRLALKSSGTLTAVAGLVVLTEIQVL